MSSRSPMIYQFAKGPAAMVPYLCLVGALAAAYFVGGPAALPWGAVVFVSYSLGSRKIIARAHRAGIGLVKQGRFDDAIPKFQESCAFFDRHPWIDRYRSLVLMSASGACYREMALANIAFCFSQIGDGQQSRQYYEECLTRFPDSNLAATALRMMDSAAKAAAKG